MFFARVFVKLSSSFLTKIGVFWNLKSIMGKLLNVTQSFKTTFHKDQI